jgi:hypothetical protein
MRVATDLQADAPQIELVNPLFVILEARVRWHDPTGRTWSLLVSVQSYKGNGSDLKERIYPRLSPHGRPVRLVPDRHKTDLELFVGMADSFVDLVVIPLKSTLVLT